MHTGGHPYFKLQKMTTIRMLNITLSGCVLACRLSELPHVFIEDFRLISPKKTFTDTKSE